MKQINRILICSGLALGLGAMTPSAVVAAQPANSSKALSQIERGNQLLHKEVRGQNNEKLGSIDDVVVDLTSGHVLYAIVNTSNGKVAVSPGTFQQWAGNSLRLNIDKQALNNAPKFTSDMDNPQALSQANFISQVYQHFGESPWWQGAAPANTGSFQGVHKLSKLIGTDVVNVNNTPMGEVKNVAIDIPAGRVLYVILSPDKDLNLGNALYALPPEAFTLNPDQKRLTSNLSRETLASAPHFNSNDWSRISDPAFASQVYQHYGKQAYFEQGSALQPTGRESSGNYNSSGNTSRGGWNRSSLQPNQPNSNTR